MFVLDPEGTILSWNSGVEQLLGFSQDEWIGQNATIIFTPTDQAEDLCHSEMRVARECGHSSDIRWHRRKDGSELFAHGYMTALRNKDGALLGYSKILSDETQNKALQDSLTESNIALEQFAYVASHDLQEPLRTMSAYAELLKRRYGQQLGEEAGKFVEMILNGSKRMSELVQDLLLYARWTGLLRTL